MYNSLLHNHHISNTISVPMHMFSYCILDSYVICQIILAWRICGISVSLLETHLTQMINHHYLSDAAHCRYTTEYWYVDIICFLRYFVKILMTRAIHITCHIFACTWYRLLSVLKRSLMEEYDHKLPAAISWIPHRLQPIIQDDHLLQNIKNEFSSPFYILVLSKVSADAAKCGCGR